MPKMEREFTFARRSDIACLSCFALFISVVINCSDQRQLRGERVHNSMRGIQHIMLGKSWQKKCEVSLAGEKRRSHREAQRDDRK